MRKQIPPELVLIVLLIVVLVVDQAKRVRISKDAARCSCDVCVGGY